MNSSSDKPCLDHYRWTERSLRRPQTPIPPALQADPDVSMQEAAKISPSRQESDLLAQMRSHRDGLEGKEEELLVPKTQIAALICSVKIMLLQQEALAASNSNKQISVTVQVIQEYVNEMR